MRKILSICLAIVLCLGVLSVVPFSAINVFAETVSGSCGENVNWSLDTETGVLNITGTGDMDNYEFANTPWYSYKNNIKTVNIANGVTSIGSYAFDSSSVSSIVIPNGVKYIADSTFYSCGALKSITLPDSLIGIGNQAFQYCGALESISLPNGLTNIGYSAFAYCGSLKRINIPDSIKSIDSTAFRFCDSLTSVYIDSATVAATLTSNYTNNSALILRAKAIMINKSISGIPQYVTTNYTYTETFSYKDATYNSYSDHQHIWEAYNMEDNGCTSPGFSGYKCSTCETLKGQVTGHSYDNACDTNCNACGKARVVEHSYSVLWAADITAHWHVCIVCGDKTDMDEHDYDNACDTDCNTCGAIREISAVLGDVDGDGYVDNTDAALILKYDAGLIDLTSEQLAVADVNGDGYVDNTDASLVLKYDAGLIPDFE